MEIAVTVISDTHCRHDELDLPGGDLLIHCGDMFNLFGGASASLRALDDWFVRQRYAQIVCTGGNHDREIEAELAQTPQPFRHAQFLRDTTIVFGGYTIHGAPWVPDLPTHAFYKRREHLADAWARVPAGIDILVTHTPPQGILDTARGGRSLGCPRLAAELPRIGPRVHAFGHVHASAGTRRIGDTLFINASSIESGTGRMRPPTVFSLSPRRS